MSRLIPKQNFIIKLKGGGTPSGAEIALTMLGEAFSSLSDKDKAKAAKSYEKQYKKDNNFRTVYEQKFNDRYGLGGFTEEGMEGAASKAQEEKAYQLALTNPEGKTLSRDDQNRVTYRNNSDIISNYNRNKENEEFNNYLNSLRNGTAQMSMSDNTATELIRQRKDPTALTDSDREQAMNQQRQDILRRLDPSMRTQTDIQDLISPEQLNYENNIRSSLIDRIGDRGLVALRFMNSEGNNLLQDNYLSADMKQYVGNIGDTSKYATYVKNPKNKYYSSLVSQANTRYGTNFRDRQDVAAFQQMLKDAGADIRVDGIIGPQTELYLAYYYGFKNDSNNAFKLMNNRRMYKNKTNEDVFNETYSYLFPNDQDESNHGKYAHKFFNGFNVPLSTYSNTPDAYGNWARYYTNGDYDSNIEKYFNPVQSNKMGGLLKKPSFLVKLKSGGQVQKLQKGRWVSVGSVTNRYNPANDHYLDELESLARQSGFNDFQIAAMIAHAIHENQGSPLPSGTRYGLWQNDAKQAKDVGNTVASNMRAFKRDYDYGKWYSTDDKNGWHPGLHKVFKNASTIDDAVYGMAGYERYNGYKDKKNATTQDRMKIGRQVYQLLQQGVKPSAMLEMLDNPDTFMADNEINNQGFIETNYQS